MMRNHDTPPYLLLEFANAHGGNPAKLEATITAAATLDYPAKGVKFQAFAPDTISLPDYSMFGVYQKITFDRATWSRLIHGANRSMDVWLDIFDSFGVEVLAENRAKIRGIKLQPSVLENHEVRRALADLGVSDKEIILNISGLTVESIRKTVEEFRTLSRHLYLQVGFQAYPTKVEDTGLGKLRDLQNADFGCKLALADHAEGTTRFARVAPALGYLLGCDLVEKHFVVARAGTEYDAFSALEPDEMEEAARFLLDVHAATTGPFINESEANYLASTIQQPIARYSLRPGELVALSDILFRRTSQSAIAFDEICGIQRERMVISHAVSANQTFSSSGFRPARIAAIVAGRLKSTRLPRKALLPIGLVPSVERCLMQCSGIQSSHATILATSTLEEDDDLVEFAFKRIDGDFEISRGDPTDVIDRYIQAARDHEVDVIIRVTADCPFVLPEIADRLVEEHFAAGADYTSARDFAVGTSVEIINVVALQRVQEHFGRCEHAEYMTWYFQNNKDFFKVNIVDLPTELVRPYRLTLDYPEDLEMFNGLLESLPSPNERVSAAELFAVLDNDPRLVAINSGLTLRYKTDRELITTLDRETRFRFASPQLARSHPR